jgi:superfamily II DNA helicase RecQ
MMQFKIFTINAFDNEDSVEKLNKFLNFNKIVEVEKHCYQTNNGILWTFCIQYINSTNLPQKTTIKPEKIDYKNVLNEDQFKTFIQLRIIRKTLADQDAVPAYAIFTDAELAEISKLDEINEQKMKSINGIGEKKILKYGQNFCESYMKLNL